MADEFKALIAKTASGAALTREEASHAFDRMMSGEATPSQMGGLLMALRVRGETVDEITGAVSAMRDKMTKVAAPPGAVDVVGTAARLPAPIEAALFFVCSEALANAAKHAGASRVRVELRTEPTQAEVSVADDGIGGASADRGSGLRGLSDRVEALGGTFRVESERGGGTRVSATIPIGALER